MSEFFGTMREPTPAVAVELGRVGIPGEPGETAARLTGADGQQILLTDPAAAVELLVKLKRVLRHLVSG